MRKNNYLDKLTVGAVPRGGGAFESSLGFL